MIIDKKVMVKIGSKNFEYYKNLGYSIKNGETILVKVEDLIKSSNALINVKCDICGKTKKIKYRSYFKNVLKYPIYCCNTSCAKIKEKETKKIKYGESYESKRVLNMKKTNLERYGCENTSKIFRNEKNKDIFINELKEIYKNIDFDYSKINYINNYTGVEIICKKHGPFKVRPVELLNGQGCKKCNREKRNNTILKKYLDKANITHNFKYDYSKTIYTRDEIKVTITCDIHGDFQQRLSDHAKGKGCEKCSNISRRLKILERINNNMKNGHQITPGFNEKACKIFDDISKNENIHIQHAMNGGEYKIKDLGYWLDGYDIENNVAYEYDEKEHYINGKLKEKDLIRQKEIIKILNCKFIRIKD